MSSVVLVIALLTASCSLHAASPPKFFSFDDFLKQHTSAIFSGEKDSLFSRFWRQALQQGIPFIDSNNTDVTFLYRGNADSVKVYGDFTSWTFKLKMRKLPETDLFYLRLSFEPDARLDYRFIVNTKEVPDPMNKGIGASGYGDQSELTMPDFIRAPELNEMPSIAKGSVTTLTQSSKALGYDHKILVYLPAGYDTSTTPLPVIYFQNGSNYLTIAKASTVLDNMIATKAIPSVIGVFVVPPTDNQHNEKTEYQMNDAYVSFFNSELVPIIDKKFRTKRTGDDRFAIGASYGGLISLYLTFTNPNLFGAVASQSGFLSYKNDTLSTLFRQSITKPFRVYLDVGTYEKNVSGFAIGTTEGNFYRANRGFKKVLEQREYEFEYRDFHDGHSWGRWRNELPYILHWFFMPKKTE